MSLRSSVEEELAGQTGWRREMALALAHEVDEKGSASAAKELRSLLAELGVTAGVARPKKETGLSDFERRLAERQSKAPRSAVSDG